MEKFSIKRRKMIEKIFTMECVDPTPTLIKGKRYYVYEYLDRIDKMKVYNENNYIISTYKFRFENLKKERMNKNVVKCINNLHFKNITVNKEYNIKESKDDYIFIKNDKNIYSKYSKKYFKNVIDAPDAEEKKPGNLCVVPSLDLTYNKRYLIKDIEGDKNMVKVINDKEHPIVVLRKRFKL